MDVYVNGIPDHEFATLETLYGKTVIAVEESASYAVAVLLEDGTEAIFNLEGECCSRSFYEDAKQFNELVGAKRLQRPKSVIIPTGKMRMMTHVR